ncbi:MAG: DNA-directed RNA polymerase subunit beta [Spirochaetes bacterium ADurb.Bin218]|jgi:DNA-directed RNA polymerase subunit beta|nr:DNA-directed RNA polymerase subunit beta [Spirochaetota bacterium]OQB00357.1 MAG: DNA-directed RNA polymerase subunit beta [Spirochaetes bacterium ADurb.Bin218]
MQESKKVVNFGRIKSKIPLPNLIELQLTSYEWFLQPKTTKRKSQGLQAVFEEIFPIESPHDDVVLEFVNYEIGEPKYSEYECKERDVTYAAPLKATIRLIRKDSMEVREQSVYMGDIPLMTERGTFIINGAERVVVNQLHRSPGIFFFYEEEERAYNVRVIPDRGSWLEFEMDPKGYLVGRIDRKKKFPVTLLIKALGIESNEEIVRMFYNTSKIKLKSEEDYESLNGRRVASDVFSKSSGEIIIEASERINIDVIDRLKEEKVSEVELIDFPNNKEDAYLCTTFQSEGEFIKKSLKLDPSHDYSVSEIALLAIHSVVRPGEPTNLENARAEFERLFFSIKTYSLSSVGRYKVNSKFGFDFDTETLTKEDILHSIRYMLYLIAEADGYEYEYTSRSGEKETKYVYTVVDDIDHLGNRRVRSVGELIMNQIKVGFQRMERVIKERMTIQDLDVITPQALISIKPITAVINEFFGSSQLSQFMDQTNPLAELTHKRRLNALGPGGLSRDRAGFEVRDVHHSHYGRMCPIETPEGPNIGLIVSLSTYARINEYGFLETPYRYIDSGRLTDRIDYLTANMEDNYSIAQANAEIDENGNFVGNLIACRHRGNFPYKKPKEIKYMDISPEQVFSVSTGLIPFLEHDDANRALMGSNMQRQAVPLLTEEAPLVGTGLEPAAAYDSGVLIIAKRGGEVSYVDASVIKIKASNGEVDTYKLQKFKRTNQGTCFNQKPIVRTGQKIKAGDILADGPATDRGRLALGKNVLVAFMPWMGYNFEDSILISERLIMDDVYTSIHIEQFEIEARETKLGPETITRDIPNLNDKAFRDLDADGIVRVGAYVQPDDILVGKVTPKGEQDLTPEYKLLYSIFGEKAREVRDTSLRVPNGVEGIVVDVKRFSRENGDELAPGVEELVKVYIADKRKISVGDKMAGRHGNKGVISKICPAYDMPYLPDGTPVDIVLNPLGVPSRMNLGQLFETELGWAAHELDVLMETPIFDGATEEDIKEALRKAGLPETSKSILYDGRSGEAFENEVMVGYMYMLKLAHMVDDKIHARSTGPYSLVTQQPLGGKAQFGGQRLGEMEVWALEAYGAAYTLQELLTVKSDDMLGRARIYEAIVKGHNTTSPGIPESFNVLIQELRGLALDVRIYDDNGNEISLSEWSEGFSKPKRKIHFETLENEDYD